MKPTRIRQHTDTERDAGQWLVEYEALPGQWFDLSIPLVSEEDAKTAELALRGESDAPQRGAAGLIGIPNEPAATNL